MKRKQMQNRIQPFEDAGSSPVDVESIESFDIRNETGFKISKTILNKTKEFQPCEPDEIFDYLKSYFRLLKVFGVYFENPKEMEAIKNNQRERLDVSVTNFSQRAGQNKTKERHSNANAPKIIFNADLKKSKMTRRQVILGKVHRFYCTALLLFHWANAVRMLSMFTPADTFGSELFYKIALCAHMILSAGMVTSLYWACATGKFTTVMIALSGVKGIHSNYLKRLNKDACRICGGMILLSFCLSIFSFIKLEDMNKPIGTPINTWIITNNKNIQILVRVGIMMILFFLPMAGFLTSSVGMILSLVITRSIVFIKRDLKSSLSLINSIEQKKNDFRRSSSVKSKNVDDAAMTKTLDIQHWQLSTPGGIISPYSDCNVNRMTACRGEISEVNVKINPIFENLRQRFQFITKVIRKADTFISISNACGIAGYLVEVILILYILLWYSCRYIGRVANLVFFGLWLVNALASLVYISFAAVIINNAAQRVLEKLHDVDLSRYSLEVLNLFSIFLTRMSTDNIGFTVLHLFVIDRNTILTITGLFLTYFLLIYQLNPDTSSYCKVTSIVNNTTPYP